MKFGQNLTYYRVRKKLNQKELAEELGVTPGYVSNIEHGNNNPPPAEMLDKISTVLSLTKEEKESFLKTAYEERIEKKTIGFESLSPFNPISKKEVKYVTIPITSWAKGGDDAIDVEPVESEFAGKTVEFKDCQAIKMFGDSLAPIAYKGDDIIYSKSRLISDGDLVYIGLKDGNKYVKRYYKDKRNGIITIQPINIANHYGPKNLREKDIEFIYRVEGVAYTQ